MATEILIIDDNSDIRNILDELIKTLVIKQDWQQILTKDYQK